MIDVVWDMETNDPDDFLTLIFLAGNPLINLKAVTILPGSEAQVGLVRHALKWFDLDIPVGVHNLNTDKQAVSDWHYEAFGHVSPSRESAPAYEVLHAMCDRTTTLLMGAPLTNLRTAIRLADNLFEVGSLVIQGGFAGTGVVPESLQMDKFKGLTVCPTHNLIHDKKASELVLRHSGFGIKRFVSKNVCHRVVYDEAMHETLNDLQDKNHALKLIWKSMDIYLKSNPSGKMLHDILAACCVIDPSVASWAEVELYRDGNAWGAKPSVGSNIWITIDYNHERFMEILTD